MVGKAANGSSLDTLKGITQQFYDYCGIVNDKGDLAEDSRSTLKTSVYKDVEEFSNLLAHSLAKYLEGDDSAVDTFKDALKIRSSLLTDPKVNDQTRAYLRDVVHISDNGKPEESLRLTKELHANALDPHYKGEKPKAAATEEISGPEAFL